VERLTVGEIGGYQFALTCAHCGARLQHRADGAVTTRGATALGECTECRALWRVDVRLACLREPAARTTTAGRHHWDATAPFAGLIRTIMQAEDELAADRD
jgi:hypothetical protein